MAGGHDQDVVVGQEPVRGIAQPARTSAVAQSTRSAIFHARDRYRQEQAQRSVKRSAFDDPLPDGSASEYDRDELRERSWSLPDGGATVADVLPAPFQAEEMRCPDEAPWSPGPVVTPGAGFDTEVLPVPSSEVPVSQAPAEDGIDPFDSVPKIEPGFALPRAKTAPRRSLFGRPREDDRAALAFDPVSGRPPSIPADASTQGPDPARHPEPRDVVVEPERLRHDNDRDDGRISPAALDFDGPSVDRPGDRPAGPLGLVPPRQAPADRVPPVRLSYELAFDRAAQLRLASDAAFRPAERDATVPADDAFEHHPTDRIVERDPVGAIAAGGEPIADLESNATVFGGMESDDDTLDMTIRLSPHLPRECRTCRDFRPADSGTRGWCTNQWAFTHRRMVDAADAPCQTTLGCWWLPNDRECLAEVDVRRHSEPTPLLDAWLIQRDLAEERAEPVRRRRRS